jgi:hypothetical protein
MNKQSYTEVLIKSTFEGADGSQKRNHTKADWPLTSHWKVDGVKGKHGRS